jgi:riboflavin transporter FmnP
VVAGTAILGAVVGILEMSRFMRIPFPLFPTLRFDVVGIPMVLTYLFFGFFPGAATCLISFVIISFRNPFSGFMKCAAELATIIGVFIVLRKKRASIPLGSNLIALVLGIISRVIVMGVINFLLLPVFLPLTPQLVMTILPLICIFNAIQGFINVFGGMLIYRAVIRRLAQ